MFNALTRALTLLGFTNAKEICYKVFEEGTSNQSWIELSCGEGVTIDAKPCYVWPTKKCGTFANKHRIFKITKTYEGSANLEAGKIVIQGKMIGKGGYSKVFRLWEEKKGEEDNYYKIVPVLKTHYYQTPKVADFNEEIIGKKNAVPGVGKTIARATSIVGKKEGILLEPLGLSLDKLFVRKKEFGTMPPNLVFILWKEMAETLKSLHLEQGLEHGDVALRNFLERNPAVDSTNMGRLFYVIDFDMAKPATQLGMVLDLFNLLSAGCKANSEKKKCPVQLWANEDSTGALLKDGDVLKKVDNLEKILIGDKYCMFLDNLDSEQSECEKLVDLLKSKGLIKDKSFKKNGEKLTEDLKAKFGDVMTRWLSSIDKLITLKLIDKEKAWKDYLQSSKNVD